MTIIVHEWDNQQRCKRCCIPKDTASKPQLCPGKPPSARQAARMRWPLDGTDAQALEGALTLTEKERDDAKAERDLAKSLHDVAVSQRDASEWLLREVEHDRDAARRERDEARAEIQRLRAKLADRDA